MTKWSVLLQPLLMHFPCIVLSVINQIDGLRKCKHLLICCCWCQLLMLKMKLILFLTSALCNIGDVEVKYKSLTEFKSKVSRNAWTLIILEADALYFMNSWSCLNCLLGEIGLDYSNFLSYLANFFLWFRDWLLSISIRRLSNLSSCDGLIRCSNG